MLILGPAVTGRYHCNISGGSGSGRADNSLCTSQEPKSHSKNTGTVGIVLMQVMLSLALRNG